jgi:hypothetical protein
MSESWLHHWQNRSWRNEVNREGARIRAAGGDQFASHGVRPGDRIFIVTIRSGRLFLGGRFTVSEITTRARAQRILRSKSLFRVGTWAIGRRAGGTPLDLHRELSPELVRRLRLQSKKGERPLHFSSPDRLDNQATRNLGHLTRRSAELLEAVLSITDVLPKSDVLLTVDSRLLAPGSLGRELDWSFSLPEELEASTFSEGRRTSIWVDRFERDPRARVACLQRYGSRCAVCRFDFGSFYGPEASGFIHVHHLDPLRGGERETDPMRDLRPVCPNCHAVLHSGRKERSIKEVRTMIRKARKIEADENRASKDSARPD